MLGVGFIQSKVYPPMILSSRKGHGKFVISNFPGRHTLDDLETISQCTSIAEAAGYMISSPFHPSLVEKY